MQPQRGLKPEDVYQWIETSGFEICGKAGIRCFSDYIGNREYMGDFQPQDVVALEKVMSSGTLSINESLHTRMGKKEQE